MSVKITKEKAIEVATMVLAKKIDEEDKEEIKKRRVELWNTVKRISGFIADGTFDEDENLLLLLKECRQENLRLHFNALFFDKIKEEPLLGYEVDAEVRDIIIEAHALLNEEAPVGRTLNMFRRWGFLGGMVRQVNTIGKIGTGGGFVALAEINAVHCSAEYVVYNMAKKHGEKITKHLAKGCIERIEEVLLEHDAI